MYKLLLINFIILTQLIFPQSSIKGFIVDDLTAENISNAVIVINNSNTFLSDSTGFFSFNIKNGQYELEVHAIGYVTKHLQINLMDKDEKELFIRLTPEPVLISTVTVTGEQFEKEVNTNTYELKPGELSKIPQVGEPDALRSIQALPGVTSINDLSTLVFLRGGNFDETLISLDHVPLYNPYHVGELFSIIKSGCNSAGKVVYFKLSE